MSRQETASLGVSIRPRRRRAAASALAPTLAGIATIVLLLAAWQAATAIAGWNTLIAPAPTTIADGFSTLFSDEGLTLRFFQTLGETMASSTLAVAVGVPIGLWMHRSRWAGPAYHTWVASLASAPIVLLYPLYLVIFGRNFVTIIAMSFCTGITPIILKTKEGLDGTRAVLVNVGRSFGLTQSQLFWKIMLPSAVPTIGNGVRLGVIYCLISVVGVEFLINFGGLGELIDDLAQRWEIPMMFGAILFVMVTSVGFFYVTEKVEKWLRPM